MSASANQTKPQRVSSIDAECSIGLSRTVWENGQPVADDLEWVRQPDGSWASCEGDEDRRIDFATVLEELVGSIRLADRSVVDGALDAADKRASPR